MKIMLILTLLLPSVSLASKFDETMSLAIQGHPDSQTKLGLMYSKGDGIPKNDVEAVKWFRKAAEQGDGPAQGFLSIKYQQGKGVPQDYIKSYVWASMMKMQGSLKEQALGEKLFSAAKELILLLGPEKILDAQSLATKCYESDYKDCD